MSRKEQRLLKAVVDRRNAAQPAELFVEPQYLLDAAEDAAFRPRRTELLALRQRLFETDAG